MDGLSIDARFAAASTETTARMTAKVAIVAGFLTLDGALLGLASEHADVTWIVWAIPALSLATALLILAQDLYIFALVEFMAKLEIYLPDDIPSLPGYNRDRVGKDAGAQWKIQYYVLGAVMLASNVAAILLSAASCAGNLAIFTLGIISASILLANICNGSRRAKKLSEEIQQLQNGIADN
ncbi:hypothetical protein [Rhodococcus sp. NPDC058481]|uniref:hypothetical protein n=1 Tax=unclassified Rhodococcus (in: high G+C Gram-positive bacteria) TaxID=192944 RepID=UPI0036465675